MEEVLVDHGQLQRQQLVECADDFLVPLHPAASG
jgi:hypothetical protein